MALTALSIMVRNSLLKGMFYDFLAGFIEETKTSVIGEIYQIGYWLIDCGLRI